jgi:DNA-binding Lrp family transcriptional regulator
MKILGALHRDASISIPKLSKDLGLNLSVTYSRIKRLVRRGIIQRYTLDINESKLGLPAGVLVGLNLDPKQREQAIGELMKLPQARELIEVTGCTVHFVDAGVDAGPIIGQQTVPVLDKDTPDSLIQRIHGAEHELYPQCVAAIARGEISVVGRRVIWKK